MSATSNVTFCHFCRVLGKSWGVACRREKTLITHSLLIHRNHLSCLKENSRNMWIKYLVHGNKVGMCDGCLYLWIPVSGFVAGQWLIAPGEAIAYYPELNFLVFNMPVPVSSSFKKKKKKANNKALTFSSHSGHVNKFTCDSGLLEESHNL